MYALIRLVLPFLPAVAGFLSGCKPIKSYSSLQAEPIPLTAMPAANLERARLMALLSKHAYLPPEKAKAEYAKLGYEAKYIDRGGSTQAYVLTGRDHKVVAVRGTEITSAADIYTDLNSSEKKFDLPFVERQYKSAAGQDAKFHSGFATSADSIYDDVRREVARPDATDQGATGKVFFTGHSLGGAVAPLLATRLAGDPTSRLAMDKESRQEIYTFGAPQIGNVAAVKGVNNAGYDLHRINTLGDLVPGSTLKLGHGPAGRELASGSIMLDADPSRLERVRQAGNSSSSVQGVFTGPKDIAKVASEGHNMDTFISDIERSMENAWRFPSGNLNRNLRPAASDPTKVTTNGSLDTPSASSDGQRAVTSQSPGHTQQAIPDTVGSKEILDSGSASSAFAP